MIQRLKSRLTPRKIAKFLAQGFLGTLWGLYWIYGGAFAFLGAMVLLTLIQDPSLNGEAADDISISLPAMSNRVQYIVLAWFAATPIIVIYTLKLWRIVPYIYHKVRR
ncbi:hypothetical protein LCGC14_3156430, partial [marine sediment metagenome]